jgi:DinB superfamily
MVISKPQETEYASFYKTYIDLIEEDVMHFLEKQVQRFNDICNNITEANSFYKYDVDKWSIKEVIGHCIDTERVMAYRLLRISRGDKTEIPGFDENEYIRNNQYDKRSWHSILDEFNALRTSNMYLINSLTELQQSQIGTANKLPISARALVYIIAGHLEHHLGILIRRYLK